MQDLFGLARDEVDVVESAAITEIRGERSHFGGVPVSGHAVFLPDQTTTTHKNRRHLVRCAQWYGKSAVCDIRPCVREASAERWASRLPIKTVGAHGYRFECFVAGGGEWGTDVSKRTYPVGVREALFMLSRGCCYEPECREPVMRVIKDGWYVNVEIAHIRAKESTGARYDTSMTLTARDSFDNLMLLCIPHHKVIDNVATQGDYPVPLLHQWKCKREGDIAAELRDWKGLHGLTEEKLQDILSDVVSAAKEEILEAIDELAVVNKEVAGLVRGLVDERFSIPYPSEDTVGMLALAADRLRHLEDNAGLLYQTSQPLKNLDGTLSQLADVTERLEEQQLYRAASTLMEAVSLAPSPRSIESNVSELTRALDRAERLKIPSPTPTRGAGQTPAPARETPSDQSWVLFKAGLVAGAVGMLVVVLGIVYLANR